MFDIILVLNAFIDIIFAIFRFPNIFWIGFPLLFTLIVMELYFGRYKNEKIDIASSLTNSLVFIFTGLDLVKLLLSEPNVTYYFFKLGVSIFLVIVGFILVYVTYFHSMSNFFYKIFTSFLIVNGLAYLVVLFVYSNYRFNLYYFIASVLFLLFLWVLFSIIHIFEPKRA